MSTALPWWRRYLRRLRRAILLIPSLMVLGTGALLAWLILTESGLAGTAQLLAWGSGDRIRLEGVRGRLFGPLGVDRLYISSAQDRYAVYGLTLAWNPMSLIDGALEVEQLTAERIELSLGDSEKPKLPASLTLPFAVRVKTLGLARLELHRLGEPPRLLASAIHGAFISDGTMHELKTLMLNVDGGQLNIHGTLSGISPFLVRAEAGLTGNGPPPVQISARLAGSLETLSIDFDGRGGDLSLAGRAGLRPFAAHPLVALRTTARGLDPRAFLASAPHARLALDVDLAEDGSGALAGYLRADNAAPAPLDQGGLPFSRAEATLFLHWASSPRIVRLDELLLRLGREGSINGRVDLAWPDAQPLPKGEAELTVRRLDPSLLHSAFRNLRLDGRVSLGSDGAAQHAQLALIDGSRHLDAALTRRGDVVTLSHLRLGQGAAELSGSGEFNADASRSWQFSGRLRNFDPAAFASVPQANLNGSIDGAGQWQPDLSGSLRFTLARSQFAGEPISGTGDLRFSGLDRPADLVAANGKAHLGGDLALQWGATRLQLQGGWGRPTERLLLSLKVPDLARHRALAPTIKGSLEVSLEGTAIRHRLRLKGALSAERQFDVQAEGGLQAVSSWRDAVWKGVLDTLSMTGDLSLALNAPAPLSAGRARLALGKTQLALAGGRVDLDELMWQPGRWSSRGRFSGLTLRPGSEKERRRHILRIGGDWALAGTPQIEGSLRAFRESGDWLLPGLLPPAQRLAGLQTLRLDARGSGGRLALDLLAEGKRLGRWQAKAVLPLTGFLIPEQVQEGTLKAAVADLGWLGPALNANLTSAGNLDVDLGFSGTLAQPKLTGHVRGQGLALGLLDQNVQLREGALAIRFAQEKAVVERLTFIAPHQPPAAAARLAGFSSAEPGRLSLGGSIDLERRVLALRAELSRLPLSQRAERWLVVSGYTLLEQGGERLRDGLDVTAELKADAGFVAEAAVARPQMADDIVVLGQSPAGRRGPPVVSDISFDFGEQFHLRVAGLVARLTGQLRLKGTVGEQGGDRLQATGSIATRDAVFEAYGQRLAVERGVVNFQGPLDDPGLNVLALRKGAAVEAGVTVTGTAQRPVVRLVSTPPVPDAEKLSWIVLGRSLDAGGTDSALLVAAAGNILGGAGGGITAQLAQALGVDEISLRQAPGSDPLSGQIVVLGKRLSARTYLSYEQGLSAASGAVKLTHSLTPRVSVVTRAGEDSAIDVFYNFSFD